MKKLIEFINEFKLNNEHVDKIKKIDLVLQKIYEDPYSTKKTDGTVNVTLLNTIELLKDYPECGNCSSIEDALDKIKKDPKRFLYNIRIPSGNWYVFFDHYRSVYHIGCADDFIGSMHCNNDTYRGEMYSPEDIAFVGKTPVDCFLFIIEKDRKWLNNAIMNGELNESEIGDLIKKSKMGRVYDSENWIKEEIENEESVSHDNYDKLMKDAVSLADDLDNFGML